MSLISRSKIAVFALGFGVAVLLGLGFLCQPIKHVVTTVASAVWGS